MISRENIEEVLKNYMNGENIEFSIQNIAKIDDEDKLFIKVKRLINGVPVSDIVIICYIRNTLLKINYRNPQIIMLIMDKMGNNISNKKFKLKEKLYNVFFR